jgi:hypothetical protein
MRMRRSEFFILNVKNVEMMYPKIKNERINSLRNRALEDVLNESIIKKVIKNFLMVIKIKDYYLG